MLTTDDAQKWGTLAAAIAAAIASSLNVWWTHSAKVDRIKVGFGPLEPPIVSGYWLHVVSQSDHSMYINNYGFIDQRGRLLSLPQLAVDEPGDCERTVVRGSRELTKRGDFFEIGSIELRDNQIGAFAATAGRGRYTMGFLYDVPWYARIWFGLKIRWRPEYQ